MRARFESQAFKDQLLSGSTGSRTVQYYDGTFGNNFVDDEYEEYDEDEYDHMEREDYDEEDEDEEEETTQRNKKEDL
jgi:hypothetical protein